MHCRDIELLNGTDLTSGDADRIFLKIKPEAQPTVNFVQFMEGLRHCAMMKRISLNDIVERAVALGGPIDNAHK
jgi:hypothetical protein